MENVGQVESVKSEICIVKGARGIGLGSVVEFSSGSKGMVMGFNHADAEVAMLSSYNRVKKGDLVRVNNPKLSIPIGPELIGRVIDPMGNPVDGLGNIEISTDVLYPVEAVAKPVHQRVLIDRPLMTGYLTIDTQIPLSLGQRELLLGERMSGQSDLAIDIICNQTRLNTELMCIYVAIDADTARIKRRIERLEKHGAMKRTIVVVARTSEAAALNYIAPMAGVTIAEWFAAKNKDVLIVFDDLTRHAKVYRQISLLLERPASRESYPGDVFYLHSRLLERCGAFSKQVGGGTITALPIVETQGEDATDFITTNLMSITDGHVLFRQTLANQGAQPPIDSGFSVSRIGDRNQPPLVRYLSEHIKDIMIKYEEIAKFSSLGSEVGNESVNILEIGERAKVIFSQSHDDYYNIRDQAILMYLIVSRSAAKWSTAQIPEFIKQVIAYAGKEPYRSMINNSVLQMSYEHAEVVFKEFMKDFLWQKDTIQPNMKRESFVAEIESVDSLLRGNEDILK